MSAKRKLMGRLLPKTHADSKNPQEQSSKSRGVSKPVGKGRYTLGVAVSQQRNPSAAPIPQDAPHHRYIPEEPEQPYPTNSSQESDGSSACSDNSTTCPSSPSLSTIEYANQLLSAKYEARTGVSVLSHRPQSPEASTTRGKPASEVSRGRNTSIARDSGAPSPPGKNAGLPESTDSVLTFSEMVAKWDGMQCALFVNDNKGLINGPHIINGLREHAARNLLVGETSVAETHISAIAVARICREDQPSAVQQFVIAMRMHKRYHDICTDERTRLKRHLGGNVSLDQDSNHEVSTGHVDILMAPLASQPIPPDELHHVLGENFVSQPPDFFLLGRVFALVRHHLPPDTLFTALPDHKGRSQAWAKVHSTIRYLITVKVAEGYCLALEAKTRRKSDAHKHSKNASAHAVIYNRSQSARRCDSRPILTKDTILVEGAGDDIEGTLQIDFGRVHTVEYKDIRAMKVGQVIDDSIDKLVQNWQKAMLHTKAR